MTCPYCVFRWQLQFHRFRDSWDGSLYVETALVLVGAAMAGMGLARECRSRRDRQDTGTPVSPVASLTHGSPASGETRPSGAGPHLALRGLRDAL